MRHKRILHFILIFGLVTGLSFAAPEHDTASRGATSTASTQFALLDASGIAIMVSGNVLYRKAEATFWEAVTINTRFYANDEVKTTALGACEIKMPGAHIVRVEPSSNFVFTAKNEEADKWSNLKLNVGKLWVKVTKGTDKKNQFALETPHASISVKGTLFSVVAPFGNVSTFEGVVQVARENMNVLVNQGYEAAINNQGFLQIPQPLSSESLSSFGDFMNQTSIPQDVLNKAKDGLIDSLKDIAPDLAEQAGQIFDAAAAQGAVDAAGAALDMVGDGLGGLLGEKTPTPNGVTENEPESVTKNITPTANVPTTENLVEDEDQAQKNPDSLIAYPIVQSFDDTSFFISNPSYLSRFQPKMVNSAYATAKESQGFRDFIDQTDDPEYRYNNSSMDFNRGLNRNIFSNKLLGLTTFERDYGVGVFLYNTQQARFFDDHVYAEEKNSVLLFLGKSFSLFDRINAGALVKGYFVSETSSKSYYNFNLNYARGTYSFRTETGFAELLAQRSFETTDFIYAVNLGASIGLTRHFLVGAGIENFVTSKVDAFGALEPVYVFNAIFTHENILLNVELQKVNRVKQDGGEEELTAFVIEPMISLPKDTLFIKKSTLRLRRVQHEFFEKTLFEARLNIAFLQLILRHEEENVPQGFDSRTEPFFPDDSRSSFAIRLNL